MRRHAKTVAESATTPTPSYEPSLSEREGESGNDVAPTDLALLARATTSWHSPLIERAAAVRAASLVGDESDAAALTLLEAAVDAMTVAQWCAATPCLDDRSTICPLIVVAGVAGRTTACRAR